MSQEAPQPNFAETVRQMLAPLSEPGKEFELAETDVHGRTVPYFVSVPQTLRELLEKAHGEFSDEVALVFGDYRQTYAELYTNICAAAAMLQSEYGIAHGDRVAICMRNYPEWIYLYLATVSIGAIIVPMNAWWVARELEYGITDSGCKAIFVDEQRAGRLKEIAKFPGDVRVCTVRCKIQGYDTWEEVFPKFADSALPQVEVSPKDVASIMYTSGTTGFPKGAYASHFSICQGIYAFKYITEATGFLLPQDDDNPDLQEAILITVPLFHVTGSTAIMLASLPIGRKMILMHKWDPLIALQQIEKEKVTAFTGVPTMTWEMLRHPKFDEFDTSTLKTIGGGGAPAPKTQALEVNERFKGNPGIGYGLTETNAVTAINAGDMYVQRPTSCGMPNRIVDVEIKGENGQVLPAGEMGEVCISSAVLFEGYWNKEEATREAIRDGFFHSGDLGYLDEDGFLYIADRAKDMILRGGENIYCAEVEAAIYEFPGVLEASVYGIPDERLGEVVGTTIVPTEGANISEQELGEFLAERIAKFKMPEFIRVRSDALPTNAAGKFLKRTLRDEHAKELGRS